MWVFEYRGRQTEQGQWVMFSRVVSFASIIHLLMTVFK